MVQIDEYGIVVSSMGISEELIKNKMEEQATATSCPPARPPRRHVHPPPPPSPRRSVGRASASTASPWRVTLSEICRTRNSQSITTLLRRLYSFALSAPWPRFSSNSTASSSSSSSSSSPFTVHLFSQPANLHRFISGNSFRLAGIFTICFIQSIKKVSRSLSIITCVAPFSRC